jgi:hypothetical protein
MTYHIQQGCLVTTASSSQAWKESRGPPTRSEEFTVKCRPQVVLQGQSIDIVTLEPFKSDDMTMLAIAA